MKRGDIVIVSAPGDYGKPRPSVVIQSDWVAGPDSVLVALLTGKIIDAPIYRLTVEPTATNGLKEVSQVMVDKIVALPRAKCGEVRGRLDDAALIALNRMLSAVLGLAD